MLPPDKDVVAITTIFRKTYLWKTKQSAPYGLTAAQVPIIVLVCMENGMQQNELVERLALEKSVVAKSVGKLITAGYLTRMANAKDKRAFDLFPTQKAFDLYPTLVQLGQECQRLLTVGLTEIEKEQLSVLLGKLESNSITQFGV